MSTKEYWITKSNLSSLVRTDYDETCKDYVTGKTGKWGPVEIRMITCKECKHWDRHEKYCGPSGFHNCKGNKFKYEETKCESDCLVYQDYEGYMNKSLWAPFLSRSVRFSTGPDFGCIHGEEDTTTE